MNHRVGQIRNIRVRKALRGDPFVIDLGIQLQGQMTAWMKKNPNDSTYRSFDILDNRYLTLSREKTSDYYDAITGELTDSIAGKWYFDVEIIEPGKTESEKKTVYTGTIFFINDVTGSNGVESLITSDLFNVEGGCARAIYLSSQVIDQGNAITT